MSSFFWTMFYSPDQSHDIEGFIQTDNLEAILSYEKLSNELQNNSNALTTYLAKQETIQRLIAYAYDPSEAKKQLALSANDVFVADIASLLDTIASSPQLLDTLFVALRPYSAAEERYLTMEEIERSSSGQEERSDAEAERHSARALPTFEPVRNQRRVPLHVSENFCRLIIMLVRSPIRLKKIQQHLLNNTGILRLFVNVISSAPSTEAIHYLLVGKDRAQESVQLQTEIVIDSNLIQLMFGLFVQNAPFDALMHASFIVCSLLANGCTAPVRNLILENLPDLLRRCLTVTSHPGTVRTLLQMSVAGFREAIRHGILSDKAEESFYYATTVEQMISASLPGMEHILSMDNRTLLGADKDYASCEPKSDGNLQYLLKQHVISALAELLRLSETTKEAIREKEEKTLSNQFRPDMSVEYLEAYYLTGWRTAAAGNATADLSDGKLLPFNIGLSYMFQDVYMHLTESTGFKFESDVAKACIDSNRLLGSANSKKCISIQHCLGPDGELIYGSSAYLTQSILKTKILDLAIAEMVANREMSVVHHACTILCTQLLEFLNFCPAISLYIFSPTFFLEAKRAVLREDNILPNAAGAYDVSKDKMVEACETRLSKQAYRTSLDAHISSILSQVGRAAYGVKSTEGSIPPFGALKTILETNEDAQFLATVLGVRECFNFQ